MSYGPQLGGVFYWISPTYHSAAAGAAHDSTFRPDVWNVSYDGILNFKMPDCTYLAVYALR